MTKANQLTFNSSQTVWKYDDDITLIYTNFKKLIQEKVSSSLSHYTKRDNDKQNTDNKHNKNAIDWKQKRLSSNWT